MNSVYTLTLRQLSGRWRLVIMSVLAALPVLMAVILVRSVGSTFVDEFESVVLKGMQADLTAARKATEEYAGALDKLSIEYDKLKNTNTALESSRKDWEDKGFTIDPTDKDIIWECYRRKLFVLAEVQAP